MDVYSSRTHAFILHDETYLGHEVGPSQVNMGEAHGSLSGAIVSSPSFPCNLCQGPSYVLYTPRQVVPS